MTNSRRVAVVTDSTASLPARLAEAAGVGVVPLEVVVGSTSYPEGDGENGSIAPEQVAAALRAHQPVSTSRPNPAEVLDVYRALATEGAEAIVSVHLSAELSGTYESAEIAARTSPVPVTAVDSRQVGMGTGFAVLAAARALDAGADAATAARTARACAAATTSLFYVDTLDYLRRGGRVGTASALVGSALAVKPILRVTDGVVAPFERVRTAGRALSRLAELAVASADTIGAAPSSDGATPAVDVAVAHLAAPERAEALAETLRSRLAGRIGDVVLGEVGAVLGAHVGPGMVAAVVAPGRRSPTG